MRNVWEYHCFLMKGEHWHSLINFLCEINEAKTQNEALLSMK
jgi:hypothetical protein